MFIAHPEKQRPPQRMKGRLQPRIVQATVFSHHLRRRAGCKLSPLQKKRPREPFETTVALMCRPLPILDQGHRRVSRIPVTAKRVHYQQMSNLHLRKPKCPPASRVGTSHSKPCRVAQDES